jgi:hypothetical protein
MISGFQPSPPAVPAIPKYSPLGLVSFALGILSLVLACGFFILAVGLGLEQRVEPERAISLGGLVLLSATLLVAVVGTGLGLVGLSRPVQRKVFSLLGIILNGVILSMFCALVVLALWQLRSGGA